ncbi:MAG: preprotein translocase subunit SecG [Hyphomicrobiales bacterium]|nr:preprotein translocase subunit SecG [Hyphomicrobiales bacterium]
MATVVLVIHLMIAAALVGSVLLQRSEGGALGIGGSGGGGGGFMTGRGTANLLTRVTAGLAAMFFVTSIILTILARQSATPTSILDGTAGPGQTQGEGILDSLRDSQPAPSQPPQPSGPAVPRSQ